MSRLRQRRANEQNLDPLLDTMANVVGILVMLVAVTQLSVGDAVERIRERAAQRSVVSPDRLEEALLESERLEAAVVAADGELEAMPPTKERRGLMLEESSTLLDELEALAGRDPLRGEGVDELRTRVEAESDELAMLQEAVEHSQSRVLDLDEILRHLPTETRPKIARLPDPRPPPPGAREIAFVCRYGRVVPLEVEAMKELLHVGITRALGDDRLVTWEDRPWLVNLFRKEAIGTGGFHWSFRESEQGRFFADVAWRDREQGESASDLRAGSSDFVQRLVSEKPHGRFVRFYVWGDSFEVYLEARYLAESREFPVSWLAVDPSDEVGIDLRGGRQTPILID